MTPVMQTTFGDGQGNCLQACLSSIFGVNILDIPWFGTRSDWYDQMNEWLARFDVVAIEIVISSVLEEDRRNLGYHLISGPSPRGDFWHAVVGKGGEMVHDPHFSGDGLVEEKQYTLFVKKFQE